MPRYKRRNMYALFAGKISKYALHVLSTSDACDAEAPHRFSAGWWGGTRLAVNTSRGTGVVAGDHIHRIMRAIMRISCDKFPRRVKIKQKLNQEGEGRRCNCCGSRYGAPAACRKVSKSYISRSLLTPLWKIAEETSKATALRKEMNASLPFPLEHLINLLFRTRLHIKIERLER